VHRIGRTGRAGRSGRAISFVAGRELFQIQQIERYTKMRIQRGKVPTADEVEEARANVFIDKLRAMLQSGEFVKHDHLVGRLLEEGFTSTDIASALIHQLQSSEATVAARPAREATPERHEPDGLRGREDRFSGRDERPRRFQGDSERRPPRFGQRREDRPVVGKVSRPPRMEAAFRSGPAIKAPARVASTPVARAPHDPEEKFDRPHKVPTPKRATASATPPPRESRRTPPNQTRLYMSIGSEKGVAPKDVVGAIMGETGLPPQSVGTVDVRERHLFVDVAADHANAIIAKLNRTRIKGERVKVKVA
jgi:ATP-dependent RNA helicase DeaD